MHTLEFVSQLSESVSDAIFLFGECPNHPKNTRLELCNDAACALTGYSTDKLLSLSPKDLFSEESKEAKLLSNPSLWCQLPIETQVGCFRSDGTDFEARLRFHNFQDAIDGSRFVLAVASDLSERDRYEAELQKAKKELGLFRDRLWAAVEALPDAFVMYDSEDRLVACNQKYKEFYKESSPAIFPGAYFDDIMRYGLENGQYPQAVGREEEWLQNWRNHHRNPKKSLDRELPDGRHIIIHDVVTANGDLVGLRTDVTRHRRQSDALEAQARALAKAHKEAEQAALTDVLTGIGNRRGLDHFLSSLNENMEEPLELGLVHVDLDRFKQINDVFGHAAGDYLLVEVARLFANLTRPKDYVARVGGDEFVFVLCHAGIEEASENVARRVIEGCSAPVNFEGKELRFGASVGIALSKNGQQASSLMQQADLALYEAKKLGRGQFCFFAPNLLTETVERKLLADEIEVALADGQFVPHFQPQVSARARRLVGVEALVRWLHPVKGLILPRDFLAVAEDIGLVGEIDNAVLAKSLSAIERLNSCGQRVPRLSVNMSARSLALGNMMNLIKSKQSLPCRLALELLETVNFEETMADVEWTIADCRSNGIEVELDDFGSGRSSLTTLAKLRPDRVKLDKSVVSALAPRARNPNLLLKAVCDVCRALEVNVTAEGIETGYQAAVAEEHGCDVLQGFFICRVLSETDLDKWLSLDDVPSGSRAIV